MCKYRPEIKKKFSLTYEGDSICSLTENNTLKDKPCSYKNSSTAALPTAPHQGSIFYVQNLQISQPHFLWFYKLPPSARFWNFLVQFFPQLEGNFMNWDVKYRPLMVF